MTSHPVIEKQHNQFPLSKFVTFWRIFVLLLYYRIYYFFDLLGQLGQYSTDINLRHGKLTLVKKQKNHGK